LAQPAHMLSGPDWIHRCEGMGKKAIVLSAVVAVSLVLTGSHLANAQSYPDRLIKIVVPFPAGDRPTSQRGS
jgi:hypothetical protein